jgi:hypothetical protein
MGEREHGAGLGGGRQRRPGYARYALSSRASGTRRSSSGSAASDTGTVWLGSLDYPPTWQHAADDLGAGGNRSQVNHMLHQSRRSPCETQCPRGVRGWQLTGSAAHPDHDDRLDRAPPRHPPGILGSVWRTPVSAEQRPWVPCQPPGRRCSTCSGRWPPYHQVSSGDGGRWSDAWDGQRSVRLSESVQSHASTWPGRFTPRSSGPTERPRSLGESARGHRPGQR